MHVYPDFTLTVLCPDRGGETMAQAKTSAEKFFASFAAKTGEMEYVAADEVATCACLRVDFSTTKPIAELRRDALLHSVGRDLVVLPKCARDFLPRLIAFDMDSTLIDKEMIDELARAAGVGEQVAQITEAAMRGELDFKASFRKRISLLKGLRESEVQTALESVALSEGAERLIETLKRRGCKTAVLSGGFSFAGNWLRSRVEIDHINTNRLDIADGRVTGEVTTEIVDGARKAQLFRSIAEAEGVPAEETIAVGDGANDLPMIALAGMGVAFRAKPKVREQAPVAISHCGLDAILHLIARD